MVFTKKQNQTKKTTFCNTIGFDAVASTYLLQQSPMHWVNLQNSPKTCSVRDYLPCCIFSFQQISLTSLGICTDSQLAFIYI